jgi:hypothetical protein
MIFKIHWVCYLPNCLKLKNILSFSSEIQLLRSKINQFKHAQSSNVDLVKESHDRLLKEKNLIIFNMPYSDTVVSLVTTSLVKEIFKELLNPILMSNAKHLSKPSNHPRPILIQLNPTRRFILYCVSTLIFAIVLGKKMCRFIRILQ